MGLLDDIYKQNQFNYDSDVGDREQEQTKDVAGRRKTIANLERQRFKKKGVDNLENNFKRNFRSIALSKCASLI